MADIIVTQNTDVTVTVTITDANGQPYDLTGATVDLEFVDAAQQPVLPVPSISVTDAANGQITITFPSSSTFPAGTLYLRLKITDSGGQVKVVPDPAATSGKGYYTVQVYE